MGVRTVFLFMLHTSHTHACYIIVPALSCEITCTVHTPMPCEESVPELKFDSLMAFNVPLVILTLGGDLASSNGKVKREYARLASLHNAAVFAGTHTGAGLVAHLDIVCLGHILHGALATTFDHKSLVGSLHATAFTFSQVAYTPALCASLHIVSCCACSWVDSLSPTPMHAHRSPSHSHGMQSRLLQPPCVKPVTGVLECPHA
jgi:hypothetical protein